MKHDLIYVENSQVTPVYNSSVFLVIWYHVIIVCRYQRNILYIYVNPLKTATEPVLGLGSPRITLDKELLLLDF